MTQWIDVVPQIQLPPGKHHVIVVKNYAIAVFNLNGEYFAIEDCCTHQGLPISEGTIEGDIITCPFHGAKFCIKTGEVTCPPAFENLTTFDVRIIAGMIQIKI